MKDEGEESELRKLAERPRGAMPDGVNGEAHAYMPRHCIEFSRSLQLCRYTRNPFHPAGRRILWSRRKPEDAGEQ